MNPFLNSFLYNFNQNNCLNYDKLRKVLALMSNSSDK